MDARHRVGEPCRKCGGVLRYVLDNRCVRCRRAKAGRIYAESRLEQRTRRILAHRHRVARAAAYEHDGRPGFLLERSDGSIFAWVPAADWLRQ